MTKFVQISGGKVITEYFCPQDPTDKPGYEEIEDDDPRYLDFSDPPWSPKAILAAMQPQLDISTSRLSIIAGKAFRQGDDATATACDDAIDALLKMTSRPEVKAATSDAALTAALTAAYAEIVTATPASVQAAFAEFRL